VRTTLVTLLFIVGPRIVGAAAEEHAQETATPFAGTIIQSVAAIIVFAILVVVLKKLAWGPILKGLQDREGRIRADLQEAEQAARRAQETLEQYRRQLSEANQKAAGILDEARREGQGVAQKIQDQARAEIEALRKKTAGEIQFAKETALQEIYAQAATLGTQLAGRVLHREIRPEDHQHLVEQVVEEFKATERN